jgi:aminopeptidase YwaD
MKLFLSIIISFFLITCALPVRSVGTVQTNQPINMLAGVKVFNVKVTTGQLNVRAVPGGNVLGYFVLGNIVAVYESTVYDGATWYKVLYNGKYGWMHCFYTQVVPTAMSWYASVVSVDNMYSLIGTLSNKDNARIAGTNSEKLAGDMLETRLKSYGYTVTRQWFPTWIKLSTGVRGANSTSSNVFAKSAHFDPLKKTVILMAHYDGVYTYAADDNASGVAMTVELARYLETRTDLHVNVVILLTGAEEGRHHGSLYYAAHPLVPLASTQLVINLDMVGAGTTYEIYNSTILMGQKYFARYAFGVGKTIGINMLYSQSTYSDHFSFEPKGIQCVTFMNLKSYTYYHTDYDTLSRIDKNVLRNISTMALNTIEEASRTY